MTAFFRTFLFFRDNALGRLLEIKEDIRIDSVYGFRRINDSRERIGFLLNMHAVREVERIKTLIFSTIQCNILILQCFYIF